MLESVLDQIPEKVKGLIQDHKDDIVQAWSMLGKQDGDGKLLIIAFYIDLFVRDRQNVCKVCISFPYDRIKDSASFTWDDKQAELKFEK